jgi:hypothetical protein
LIIRRYVNINVYTIDVSYTHHRRIIIDVSIDYFHLFPSLALDGRNSLLAVGGTAGGWEKRGAQIGKTDSFPHVKFSYGTD